MEIQLMREFVTLAQKLNYSKASALLGVTQSTLSKHIIALEKELGFRLLERSTTSVRLTSGGSIFLEEAHGVLEAYDAAISRTHERLRKASRKVVINGNVHHPAFTRTLGYALHSYQAQGEPFVLDQSRGQYSSVNDLLENDSSDVFVLLNSGIIDRDRFEVVPLFRDEMRVLFPSTHPKAARGPICLEELESEKLLVVMGDSSFEDWYYLREVLATRGLHPQTKLLKFESIYGVMNSMAYESRYILPRGMLAQWTGIVEEFLTPVPIAGEGCFYEYCLVYRKDTDNAFVRDFVSRLQEFIVKTPSVTPCTQG